MRLLLDTHTFLWWVTDDPALSEKARRLLSDPLNEVFFSAASGWEITIKMGTGKLHLPEPPDVYIPDRLVRNAFQPLAITIAHTLRIWRLPRLHRDPFDRLLVAQALEENMPLLTTDPLIRAYPVTVWW
jgi:PIN domain nuclease of toxin-antitoxin system